MAPIERARMDESLGRSEAFQVFQERLSRVAKVERPVLLIGERGTGKELAAARLHFLSRRWQEPLVTLNCAALTPSLITSELFGHEAGAFTGADKRRQGRFEAAHSGSLFLDEIGNIPMEAQEKILRVVEYGSFEPVGSNRSVEVDVRLIGATHADLPGLAERGEFKRDLLDRLSFEVLRLPALRERTGDVLLLAAHFAARMSAELGRGSAPEFSDQALAAMSAHPWPGNIRELKNVVERAVYRTDGDRIEPEAIDFDPFHPGGQPPARLDEGFAALPRPAPDAPLPHLPAAVRALELRLLAAALERSRHHQGKAAELLGLSYHQFRGLFRKHASDLSGRSRDD